MSGGWWFLGMHLFWWIFWVGIIASFFSLLTPVPKQRARSSALEILQRRLAAGEVTPEEYERRKAVLVRDGAGRPMNWPSTATDLTTRSK